MEFRNWFRPPRHVLAIFVAVAVVSAGALAWLMWLLLEQDKAVEMQRRQERLEQAADRAAAVVSGLPAGLVAREGRASAFEEMHRASDLRTEATAILEHLHRGRWQLTKSQYEFYVAEAKAWLGTSDKADDPDAVAQAEAVA